MKNITILIIYTLIISSCSANTKDNTSSQAINNNIPIPHIVAAASINYPKQHIKKILITNLLKEKKYGELESTLNKLQEDYENDLVGEMQVWHAFESFSNTDPDMEKPLIDWHDKYPKSASASLALGRYYENLGMHSRGGKLYFRLTSRAMKTMSEYLIISKNYYYKTLKTNNKLLPAYFGLIRVSQRISNQKDIQHFYKKAAEISPSSYLLNRFYLATLQPKWGGSRLKISRHIKEIKRFFNTNAKLASLGGYLDYSDADSTKNCAASLELLDRAIQKGDNPFYYIKRGYKYRCLKRYEEAWSDFTKGIQLQPETASYHITRGELLYKSKDYEDALVDFDQAISVDALSWGALQGRGHIYLYQKKYEEAMLDLNNMLVFSDNKKANRIAYEKIANVNLLLLKNFKEAIVFFKKLIIINPKSHKHWAGITGSYLALNRCEAIESSNEYFKLCEKYNLCDVFDKKSISSMVKTISETKCNAL